MLILPNTYNRALAISVINALEYLDIEYKETNLGIEIKATPEELRKKIEEKNLEKVKVLINYLIEENDKCSFEEA